MRGSFYPVPSTAPRLGKGGQAGVGCAVPRARGHLRAHHDAGALQHRQAAQRVARQEALAAGAHHHHLLRVLQQEAVTASHVAARRGSAGGCRSGARGRPAGGGRCGAAGGAAAQGGRSREGGAGASARRRPAHPPGSARFPPAGAAAAWVLTTRGRVSNKRYRAVSSFLVAQSMFWANVVETIVPNF